MVYNAAHSYLAPMALMTAGFATAEPLVLSIAMIWLAHIGFDRALGYGLKYASGFGFTHLGRIGKKDRPGVNLQMPKASTALTDQLQDLQSWLASRTEIG